MLHHNAIDAPLSLQTITSRDVIGATLQLKVNDLWQPITLFVQNSEAGQKELNLFDREPLAIVKALTHFQHLLEGRTFTVYADHRPLATAMNSPHERPPHLAHHFNSVLRHTTNVWWSSDDIDQAADDDPRFAQALDSIHRHDS